jgi:hypothetical protein
MESFKRIGRSEVHAASNDFDPIVNDFTRSGHSLIPPVRILILDQGREGCGFLTAADKSYNKPFPTSRSLSSPAFYVVT